MILLKITYGAKYIYIVNLNIRATFCWRREEGELQCAYICEFPPSLLASPEPEPCKGGGGGGLAVAPPPLVLWPYNIHGLVK